MMFLRNTTEVIWAFTGTVLGLIVSVALSSIVRQIRHNSTGSSQADRWENATDSVMGFVDGDDARMARFSKLLKADETRPIVIEALSNIARTNAKCSVRLRDRDADVAILRQWVSDSLEDKDAGRRAHACEVVGTLRLRACRGMVLAATGDEDVNVKVSATRAMAVIDPESAVGVLLGLIEEEGTWAADLLADLLQRIPASATEAVLLRAREWGATPALVKLLASSPSALANDVLLGALETNDPELRARTAEAVHASSPEAVAALSTLLTDPHEGTRLSAVRSLSRAANPDALLTLSSALSDSSRLVRFAAASGIAGTPGGAGVLSRVLTGADRNAAEAAELALWRLQAGAITAVRSNAELESILASQEPALKDSVTKRVASNPTVKKSSNSDAVAQSAERKSAVAEPGFSKPVGLKPVGSKLLGSKPAGLKPVASKLLGSKPVGSKPNSQPQPAVPAGSKPVGSKPAGSKPVGLKPVGLKPVGLKPVGLKPVGSKLLGSKPAGSKLLASKLLGSKPAGSKPVASKPVASKLLESKPGESKPNPQPQPAVPAGSKPGVLKSAVLKSAGSKPVLTELVLKATALDLSVPEPRAAKPSVAKSGEMYSGVSKSGVSKPAAPKSGVVKPGLPKFGASESGASKSDVVQFGAVKPGVSEVSGSKRHGKVVAERRAAALTPFPKQGRRKHEVLAWLEAFLIANGGVASAPEVKAAAAQEGIAERTLERVRPGIATSARQGFGEPANWELINKRSLVDAS